MHSSACTMIPPWKPSGSSSFWSGTTGSSRPCSTPSTSSATGSTASRRTGGMPPAGWSICRSRSTGRTRSAFRRSRNADGACPRSLVIDRARAAAQDSGVELGGYDATVVMMHPAVHTTVNGETFRYDVGSSGTRCLLPVWEDFTYFCHEVGHTIGFDHSYGIPNTGADWDGALNGWMFSPVYGDPYDLMSSASFGGATSSFDLPTAAMGTRVQARRPAAGEGAAALRQGCAVRRDRPDGPSERECHAGRRPRPCRARRARTPRAAHLAPRWRGR